MTDSTLARRAREMVLAPAVNSKPVRSRPVVVEPGRASVEARVRASREEHGVWPTGPVVGGWG